MLARNLRQFIVQLDPIMRASLIISRQFFIWSLLKTIWPDKRHNIKRFNHVFLNSINNLLFNNFVLDHLFPILKIWVFKKWFWCTVCLRTSALGNYVSGIHFSNTEGQQPFKITCKLTPDTNHITRFGAEGERQVITSKKMYDSNYHDNYIFIICPFSKSQNLMIQLFFHLTKKKISVLIFND